MEDLVITPDMTSELDKQLRETLTINVKFDVNVVENNKNHKDFVTTIRLEISDCRQRMQMQRDGSSTFSNIPGFHTHQDLNHVQTELSKMEKAYQSPLRETKAELVMKDIFENENDNAPFNQFLTGIKSTALKGKVHFRIAFNCDYIHLEKIPAQERKYAARAILKFSEIDLFLKKVNEEMPFFGKPLCTFIWQNKAVEDMWETDAEDHPRLIAEYMIDTAAFAQQPEN